MPRLSAGVTTTFQQAAALGRAQLQLQSYLLQLHMEGRVAAGLASDSPPPSHGAAQHARKVLGGTTAASAQAQHELELDRYVKYSGQPLHSLPAHTL